MSKGSNSQTTQSTNSVAPNPQAMSAYQGLLSRVQGVSETPFQPYTGPEVAPINAQQQAGIATGNAGAAGFAPVAGNAGTYINAAGQPVSAADISQYMDPYTGAVINATQADFDVQNQRAQSATTGNAAAQGALGGNRVGVAQALTQEGQERVQAPVMARLRSEGFQSAEQMANAQKQRELQAGQVLSQEDLRQAQGQFAFGTAEQQTQQAQYTQAMTDYFVQQGYPFATAQWLAGITLPTGAQMGQTTTGQSTTTGPQPNQWLQGAGLGFLGLGALGQAGGSAGIGGLFALSDERLKENVHEIGRLHDGQKIYRYNFKGDPQTQVGLLSQEVEKSHPDAVHKVGGFGAVDYDQATADAVKKWSGGAIKGFAGGGSPSMPYPGGQGWVPTIGLTGTPLQAAPMPKEPNLLSPQGDITKGLGKGLADAIKAAKGTGPSTAPTPVSDSEIEDLLAKTPEDVADGGGIPISTGFAGGGSVIDRVAKDIKGYANGGLSGQSGDLPEEDYSDMPPLQYSQSGTWDRAAADKTAAMSGVSPSDTNDERMPPDQSLVKYMPVKDAVARAIPVGATARQIIGVPHNQPPDIRGAGLAPYDDSEARKSAFNQSLMSMGAAMMRQRVGGRGSFLAGMGEGVEQGMGTYASSLGASAAQAAQARKEAFEREKFAELKRQHDLPYSGQLTTAEQMKMALEKAKLAETQRQHNLALRTPVKYAETLQGTLYALPKAAPDGTVEFWPIDPKTGQVGASPLGGSLADSARRNSETATPAPETRSAVYNPDEGVVTRINKVNEEASKTGGRYDYSGIDPEKPIPYVEKGMEIPKPQETGGFSTQNIETEAERYLQTGKLPTVRGGNSPVARGQQAYKQAVANYASAIAASRGLSPEDMATMWRQAPETYRFIRSAAGNATVSLGTAVRHLDTLRELQKAWNAGDTQTLNQIKATIARQFGDASVTSLEAAANIVGAEIIKAIIGSQSGQSERDEARKLFTPLLSGAQAYGNIDTVQKLLGGQLEGKERQAKNLGVSEKQFKDLIGDRPYEILKSVGAAPVAVEGKTRADVPAGSQKGTKGGQPVWRTPDGQFIPRKGD